MVTVYVDTETGGVLPQHPTIQLAAVAMRGDVELASFEQKIQFNEADCDPEALKMNHYTAEAWADAVSPAIAASRFAAWLRPHSTVPKVSKAGKPYNVARVSGYNYVAFDGPRVRALFGTQFCPLEFLARDVLQRVLFYFDETGETPPENFKLSTVAAHFGLSTDGAHDALADARMAAKVYAAVKGEPIW
jgi:DNA polymerase III epsilon subunit-like protein